MNKTTYVRAGLVLLLILMSSTLFSQNFVPFTPRFNQDLKGDIVLIGNNILGPDNNAFNDNSVYNHNVDMTYIDIDGDASTFNSTSADLVIPNPGCYRIIHAGLYWSAVTEGSESFTNVKFKGPTGGYNDVVGTIVFDANGTSVDGGNSFPYACYADVTSIVTGLANNLGTYTVGNVSSAQGETANDNPFNGTGHSAGWSLFVVFEDPTLPGKSITSFDGFSSISLSQNPSVDITVSGFRTVPAPAPVRANFAFATLEGDSPILGDQLLLNGVNLSTADRSATNFFNSSVTQLSALPVNNRVPNSTNTLGFDTGVIAVPNPGNGVIANDATSAEVSLDTSGDTYFPYFFALAVDIIEPNIVLTKIVEDASGTNIGGQLVNLGDELNYVIGFQNTGNDDATNLTIRDILPTNIVYNHPADMGLLPPGVTVQSYNATTRELIFNVDNSVVEEHDQVQDIRFKVTVVSECSLLSDACSNIITNQAFSTYNGTLNPTFTISDDPSFSTNTGCLLTPAATNFLADINCTFTENVILCGASTVLTAANGYDSYSWSTNASGTPVIGTSQSITVTSTGTYYVANTAIAPCQSIEQEFTVVTFGGNIDNPVIPFADEVVTCPNDGKLLPNIFLCGANDSRSIQTNITDTASMIWEVLDEASCTAVTNPDCANEDTACTWNQVTTGPNFMADTAGQYRLTLNYAGGCFNQFYFNVYTNLLIPTVNSRDIICTTPGEIVVGGVPSGYEYSIDNINYQPSNVFSINTPNIYSVYVRQIGVTPNPCIFSVPDVQIRQRDFTVSTIITQPYCNGGQGSVILAANDVRPQYFFSIYNGATLVNSVGPINDSSYTFANLNPGTYTVNVSTEDGCTFTGDIVIINPPILTATSALTKPLTCTDGEITVYPVGGTPPYFYFVNGSATFQTTPIINVPTAGTYNISVVDSNNCSADTSIIVEATPAPDFTVTKTDILCSDAGDVGTISINVTNPNGNSLEYSIDNGVTFFNSPIFTGVSAGNHDVVVQYTTGTDVCISAPQIITINTQTAISGTATLTTPYTCLTNGVITVSGVLGGTAPYSYSLNGITFQPGLVFSGLVDGSYTVTIRDANDCAFLTTPIIIAPLNPPTDLTFSNSPLSCPSLTSDVTITGTTGGTVPLEYQIIAPAASVTAYQNSAIFSGLSPNTYTFQVRDANNCVYSESYTIAPLPPLTVSTIVTKDLDCTASPDGNISGTISGGTSPFTYAVSFNGGAYSGSNSVVGTIFNHTVTTDGTYQFQITDANGCTSESGIQTINIISLPEITSVIETQPILCHGDSNAAIEITINNTVGTPNFIINVHNDTTGTDYGTQTSGLPAGDYTITLTDENLCSDTGTITIAEPSLINLSYSVDPISCGAGGVSLGRIIINSVSGGTPNYTYHVTGVNGYNNQLINQTGSTQVFEVVDFGLYEIIITDDNGCFVVEQDILVASPPDNLITINTTADCTTGGEALVSVGTTLAGSGPYHFAIYTGPGMTYTAPTAFPWQDESLVGSEQTTFTNLLPGVTYTFIVFDELTGCYYYEIATTPIPTNSTLTGSALTSNNITCVGSADGNVSFTVNSIYGTPTNINYEIYDSLSIQPTAVSGTGIVPAGGSLPISNLGPLPFGNYFVLITETSGSNVDCSVVTIPFNITESAIDLGITASVDANANCNLNSGRISAIGTDGTPPYLYQLTTSATPPLATDPSWASANVFNRDANSYYAHVKDVNGCIRTTLVLVLPSDPEPVITAVTNNQCTVTEGDFEIDVALTTAGITPYSYSIDGGAFQTRTAPFSISNLASGTHTVEIQDANGCGNLVTVDIETPIGLSPAVTALPTCNNDDGQITISGSGGTGTYTYSISPNLGSLSGNIFSDLPSGTYTITITDAATLCSEDVTIVLPASTPLTFSTVPTAITCFGNNNGAFEINVSGYSGPYTYEVFDSASLSVFGIVAANTSTNPELVSGLLAGTYSVVITETASPFCSASSSVIISSPIEALTLVATETSNVTCDDDKGTITSIASGGWGTYEYELTGTATVAYSSNGTFTNLSIGSYTVNVRDAGGCITSENVTLDLPTPIDGTITASTNLLACFGDTDATITVSAVTGGQGTNYSYTLNMVSPTVTSSGPQTSPIFDNLGIGTYNVSITDGYNCSFTTLDITITEPTQVQASLVKETSQTCLTPTTLTLSATGGTGPYEYSDTASFGTVQGPFITSVTFPVSNGTYQYYVRDANGCSANISNEITIDPLPTLLVNLDAMNATINCAGDTTGVIIATAQGGLGSYVYTLQDTSGNAILPVTQNSPGVFTELPAGNYQVRVDSGDCYNTSTQVPITEPATPLTANFDPTNVTCPGSNNGRLEITASGGTGIIKYAISPQLNQFFDSPIFENLTPGNYQAIAQDESGCFIIDNFMIDEPIAVTLNIVGNSIVPEVCDGDLDGEFSIEISGGNLPYSVSIDDIHGPYTTGTLTQTQFDFTALAGDDHLVYVRDDLGCETEWNVTFPKSVLINPEVEVEFGCTNNVSTNTVTVTVDASITDLSDLDYSLNGGPYHVNNIFIDVPPGIGHFIDVRHTNGCIKRTELFDVSQYDPLQLALDDGEINQIVAMTSGGAAPYTYTLNGENYDNENTFFIYESGDYTVTVTDSNGCFTSATKYFEFIKVCIPNYFTPNSEGWGPGCANQYKDLTVDIFDRYGRKVATLRVGDTWDGKYNGIELPTGDYWYVVKLNDPKNNREFVGHFTLYR